MQLENQKVWLVKSGGRISGPFTTQEVIDRIAGRELTPLDEVSLPMRRWHYVRENRYFSALAAKVHHSADSPDRTQTLTRPESTTAGSTRTMSQTIELLDERSYSPTPTDALSEDEILIDQGEQTRETPRSKPHQKSRKHEEPIRQYGYQVGNDVRHRAQKTQSRLWLVSLVIVAVGAFYLYSHKKSRGPAGTSFDDIAKRALVAKEQGKFTEALSLYQQAYNMDSSEFDVSFPYAVLKTSVERQTVVSKRVLQRLMGHETSPDLRKLIFSALALVSLYERDLSSGLNWSNQALAIDPHYGNALINRGMINYMRKKWQLARNDFSQVAKHYEKLDSTVALSQILLARAQMQLWNGQENSVAMEIVQNLGSFAQRSYDYRIEAQFLRLYASQRAGDQPMAQAILNTLLDIDPRLTDDHVHEPLAYDGLTKWQEFSSLCDQVSQSGKGPRYVALKGYCLFKNGRLLDGRKKLSQALTQAPQDHLIHGLQAYILLEMDRSGEAQGALKFATQQNEYVLPHIVKARMCNEQGDFICAEESWGKVLDISPSSLSAIAGLAELHYLAGRRQQALQMISRGLQMSRHYEPLLRLKEKLR